MKIHSFTQFLEESKNPCWSGYRQIGTKSKNGKKVPNCVPVKESEDDDEKTYSFEELSDEAKQNAIENNREIASEGYDWWDPIIEGAVEDLEAIGMKDVDIEFNGFYSQGDGASFTGKVSDNKKFLTSLGINPFESKLKMGGRNTSPERMDALFSDFCDNIYISISRDSSRYVHKNTISASVEVDGEDEMEMDLGLGVIINLNITELCDHIEPEITKWAREKSDEIYKDLEKYNEELHSDKTVESDLKSGGYRFDEEGNMV